MTRRQKTGRLPPPHTAAAPPVEAPSGAHAARGPQKARHLGHSASACPPAGCLPARPAPANAFLPNRAACAQILSAALT